MKKGCSFDFETTYHERALRLTGVITAYYPAVMYLRNGDPGYPAEGGEIEDLKIFLVQEVGGKKKETELRDRVGRIGEKLTDEIYEWVADNDDHGIED